MSNWSYTTACGAYMDILKTMWALDLTVDYPMGCGQDEDRFFIAWVESEV